METVYFNAGFEVLIAVVMKSCFMGYNDVSEEHIASIFRVEE
jgi:hypothetical protein